MIILRLDQKSPRGFTLTELAIVLGIIGIVLGAIWTAASRVYTNNKVRTATTELLAISQGVRDLYASQTSISGWDITLALMNAGVFPSDMISGGQPVSPWGSPVEVIAGWPDAQHFIVEFSGQDRGRTAIPSSLCAPLLMANYASTAPEVSPLNVEYLPGTWVAYNVANPGTLFSTCTTASFVYSMRP